MKAPKHTRREPRLSPENQASTEMLAAARAVVSQALPQTFQINGRTLWLTVGINFAQVKIFATPEKTAPIAEQLFSAMPVDSPDDTNEQRYQISALPLRRL